MSTFWGSFPTKVVMPSTSVRLPSDELSDRHLVDAVVEHGSQLAFRELYQRHTPRLHRLALRMTATPHEAEDAVQETWLRAAIGLRKFAWRSTLATWLFGVAVNVLREHLAREGHGMDVSADDVMLTAAPVHETIDLERAVHALAPGARAVFLLHDVEGFTHEEIATQLGVTAGTSRTQLHRARRALRERLREFWSGEET